MDSTSLARLGGGWLGYIPAFCGLALAVMLESESASASTATVNSTGSQTVKGWGCFPSYFRTDWSAAHQFDMFDKPRIQDAVFDLGITHIRVDVQTRLYVSGTTLGNIVLNTAAVDDLVHQIQIARNHGINNYIMSCWSPPAVWKDNGSVNGGHLLAGHTSAYVAYYIKVLQTLNARGVGLPVALSFQNEPDLIASYDSCIYTDSGNGYALWRQLVKDFRAALDSNGMGSVIVHGPECTSTDKDIALLGIVNFSALTNDPALDAALGAYASHTYGESVWLGMRSGMAAHPKDAWITEWSIFDNKFGTTENDWMLGTMRHMASNFVDLPFNYWFWWVAWNNSSGNPNSFNLLGGSEAPIYSKRYWVFQRLWTTVRPGWIVHKMTCDDPDYKTSNNADVPYQDTLVDLVSFRNAAGTASVTMLINKTTSTDSMTVNGLVGTKYAAYRSDAAHDMTNFANGNVSGGSATVSLTPKSVTLLMTSSAVPAAPSGLAAAATEPGVALSWSPVYGATGYAVSRASASGGPYATIGTTGTALDYHDTTAAAGTIYYYRVAAVNPSGQGGPSPVASINVPHIRRQGIADAYVRNGSHANTNYGSAVDLVSKLDPTSGYTRESFLRFDVSGLANAESVKVWLVPTSTGSKGWLTSLAYEFVSDDTGWSEGGIKWSNKPAGSGTLFPCDANGYFVGQLVEVDVTAQAKAEAAGDGMLSMRIHSLASDVDKGITFASMQNTAVPSAYRPALVYAIQQSSNPLANPGFESGTSGWTFTSDNGMSSVTPAAARSGAQGLHVSDASPGLGSSAESAKVGVAPGAACLVTGYARANNGNSVGIYLRFYNASGIKLSEQQVKINASGSTWQSYTLSQTAPANAATVSVWIHSYLAATVSADFDDLTLVIAP